ncbi:MAG: FHA domain-containing protein [Planctomycetota bacterium]|nr:FHA domain-containing protein [Planctomycetota bacterium]MDG2142224.1 FHA domain-containing protein [Planctomycetota bacterium]
MLRLIVLSGPDEGRDASLTDGSRIGRGPASGLRLSDRSISREHAAISQRGDQWFAVDMGSTNGLWDGEERVDEVLLTDGCVIRLGEVRLEAQLREAKTTPAEPKPSTKESFSGSILGADVQAEKAKPEASMEFSVGGGAMPVADTEDELEIEWADEDQDEVHAPAPESAAPAAKPAVRDLQRDELLRNMQANKGGLARADLGQLPVWMRALLVLGVLAASGAVFYFVMQAVLATRS